MQDFDFLRPKTLTELIGILADTSGCILAGGTDIIPKMRRAQFMARTLVDISEIDELLRAEHKEDYCGIVYADDLQNPTFIKIFDPNNLGVSCGFSDHPPLPGWVLSLSKPEDLPNAFPPPQNRRRWWQRLIHYG